VITVVIPYFQRETGVLRRALQSVADQRGCALPLHVIIVDDESPAPPEPEIAAAGTLAGTLTLLKQRNGGPASARNKALDHAPSDTRYVAFLDSDDAWSPDHLARAVTCLEAGHDCFFGDFFQLGQSQGAFSRAGRLHPADHPTVGSHATLHAFRGDMFDQILSGNVIGTPTVVYAFECLRDHRFRTEFTSAGEDYLFWMGMAKRSTRFAFSSEIEATCGRGVNVYSGAGWGTPRHLERLHNELRYRKTIGRLFDITPAQRKVIAASVAQLRRSVARDLLHRLRHRCPTPPVLLAAHLRLDPLSFAMLPAVALSTLARRS
jgi:succinoglycan biosynthesis protein ExoW